MNLQIPILGGLYISLTGRDKGKIYIALKVVDPEFILAADGKTRKVSNPKKKRLKHLKAVPGVMAPPALLQQITAGTVKDNEIDRFIQSNP